MKIGEFEFRDGGIGANNPSFVAYHEVLMMHNDNREAIGLILSIGTGARSEEEEQQARTGVFAEAREIGDMVTW